MCSSSQDNTQDFRPCIPRIDRPIVKDFRVDCVLAGPYGDDITVAAQIMAKDITVAMARPA